MGKRGKGKIINKIYQANPFQPFTRRIFSLACHGAFGFIRILIVRKQVGVYTWDSCWKVVMCISLLFFLSSFLLKLLFLEIYDISLWEYKRSFLSEIIFTQQMGEKIFATFTPVHQLDLPPMFSVIEPKQQQQLFCAKCCCFSIGILFGNASLSNGKFTHP